MVTWLMAGLMLAGAGDTSRIAGPTGPSRADAQMVSANRLVTFAVARTGPRFTADSWTHDVGHVTTPFVVTLAVYGMSREAGVSRSGARWIAVGTSLALMVLKEMYDRNAVDNFSGRDIVLGVVG